MNYGPAVNNFLFGANKPLQPTEHEQFFEWPLSSFSNFLKIKAVLDKIDTSKIEPNIFNEIENIFERLAPCFQLWRYQWRGTWQLYTPLQNSGKKTNDF